MHAYYLTISTTLCKILDTPLVAPLLHAHTASYRTRRYRKLVFVTASHCSVCHSSVSVDLPTDSCALVNIPTTTFVSVVLILSLALNYLPSHISDWHSVLVSGLFVVYSLITVQSGVAVACILLLGYQVWCRLGDDRSCQFCHKSFSKDL